MVDYRLHSEHSEDLDDGRVLDPGAFHELDDKAASLPRAASLIEDGKLVPVERTEPQAAPATKNSGSQKGGDSS